MSKKESSIIRFRSFSATVGSVFDRARRRTPRAEGENAESEDVDKSAYTRRREQIRRAQRKHRERKQVYIESLEKKILELHEEVASRKEFQEASLENSILKEILLEHNIEIPPSRHSTADVMQVSLVGTSKSPQMLLAQISPDSNGTSQKFQLNQSLSAAGTANTASDHTQQMYVSPPESFEQSPPGPVTLPKTTGPWSQTHPHGLDSAQAGIDFVLLLEKPCLEHTMHPMQAGESHGHALTLQASLLSHAPKLGAEGSWAAPAVEFDRLYQLSTRLDLDGEVTPVQAWNHIKSHDYFRGLTPAGLTALRDAIAKKISCFGFGAVIEEFELLDILEAHLGKHSR